ncbi:MAG TPA: OmpA family protein [Candidatus Babeliales bacterium]|jgi:outer membrane protein OmpA-like peptidoglycan-associated protein|nr:OmpA family protein [Candidatus Babeliales bacterium]
MKKMSLLVIALIVALPGCCNKQDKKVARSVKRTTVQKYMQVDGDIEDLDEDELEDMELPEEEDIASFEFPEDEEMEEIDLSDLDLGDMGDLDENEYSWIDAQSDDEFRKLYFSFNHYGIRDDQKSALNYDIEQVKQLLVEADTAEPTIVIEGHACQEGAPAYNLALSERRAKTVADLFVAAGVDRTAIKVVGRGQECPVTDGRTRAERNPNRRVEVRVIYT